MVTFAEAFLVVGLVWGVLGAICFIYYVKMTYGDDD
jgi:hypothetical protein